MLGACLVGMLGGGTGATFLFLAACLLASALPLFRIRARRRRLHRPPSRRSQRGKRPGRGAGASRVPGRRRVAA
ncbi:MAG: hypothetical protein ACLQDY_05600 [Streptosporangiaceae bacterium]